jgi:tetratricopeptide (TPR) repeat protein
VTSSFLALLGLAAALAGTADAVDSRIASHREAVRLDPRNAAARNALGSLLNSLGHYAEALPHVEEAVLLEPANPRFRYNRGVVLAEHGRFAQAIADFDLALAALPDLTYAWLERGAARYASGQVDGARADWARAREIAPELIWTVWYPATADLVEGRYAAAAAAFDRVMAAEPGFAPAAVWSVAAHARAGTPIAVPAASSAEWPAPVLEFQRGALAAERLLELAREDRVSGDRRREGEAHYFIAQHLLAAGRREEATRHLRSALAAPAPRHIWKTSAQAELDRLGAVPG